jgi:tellurite methyltransferase
MLPQDESGPSAWVEASADLWAPGGEALDVACGRGRHALLLAAQGLRVHALDRDAGAVAALARAAAARGLDVRAEVRDLEAGEGDLGHEAYDLIVVVHYLHRPLFPALRRALRPGGRLVYETFTTRQAERGRPRNPRYLLQPGELPRLVAPLVVERAREGDYEGRWISSVVAVRASAS